MTADKTPEEIGDDDLDAVQGAGTKILQSAPDRDGGRASVYPDVCKIPAPPGPPSAAVPYPDAVDSYDTVGGKSAKSSKPAPGASLNKGI